MEFIKYYLHILSCAVACWRRKFKDWRNGIIRYCVEFGAFCAILYFLPHYFDGISLKDEARSIFAGVGALLLLVAAELLWEIIATPVRVYWRQAELLRQADEFVETVSQTDKLQSEILEICRSGHALQKANASQEQHAAWQDTAIEYVRRVFDPASGYPMEIISTVGSVKTAEILSLLENMAAQVNIRFNGDKTSLYSLVKTYAGMSDNERKLLGIEFKTNSRRTET